MIMWVVRPIRSEMIPAIGGSTVTAMPAASAAWKPTDGGSFRVLTT